MAVFGAFDSLREIYVTAFSPAIKFQDSNGFQAAGSACYTCGGYGHMFCDCTKGQKCYECHGHLVGAGGSTCYTCGAWGGSTCYRCRAWGGSTCYACRTSGGST